MKRNIAGTERENIEVGKAIETNEKLMGEKMQTDTRKDKQEMKKNVAENVKVEKKTMEVNS